MNFLSSKIKMIDVIFNNNFYKLCIGFILSLLLTFAHEIHVLKEYWILIPIAIVTLLLLSNNISNDLGIILLMIAILILTYNQTINKKSKNYHS
jgi:hypothetical protein